MKPNDTVYSNEDDNTSLNFNTSNSDSHESLLKEKESSLKKSSNNNATDAPFYDELHFANYE